MLEYLRHLPTSILWLIFLVENAAITFAVLYIGRKVLEKSGAAACIHTTKEKWICTVTNLLNTAFTFAGFWLWKQGIITISNSISWAVLLHFIVLFLAMDLLMFVFHYLIHKTFLYKAVHGLHHEATDPKPIDLFILHPVETIAFGGMWVGLLTLYTFNIYAIIIYLIVNVVFGLAGHLGLEPLPIRLREQPLIRYLGTSTFHHNHHRDIDCNFGFYTSVWDRLMGTYKA